MTAISDKYAALGGASGFLGATVGDELWCPDQIGRFRHYQRGSIYWHPDTGAHEVHGMIRERWKALGWERSWLGYPVTDELDAARGGKISRFQAGAVSWRPDRGAWDHGELVTFGRQACTHAEHQADVDARIKRGWRLLSLCVHGDSGSPRYTTVWIRRPGPAWAAIHGASPDAFHAWVEQQAARGLTPTLVTAIGDKRHVLAGVAEAVPPGTARWGLRKGNSTPDTFGWWVDWARRNHQILTCVSAYGSSRDPRFAAIWRPNPGNVAWDVLPSLASSRVEQARFAAHTQHGARASFSARHPSRRYVSVYRDDAIGPWLSKGEMTQATFEAEKTARAAEGYAPISVQAGGSGSDTRFTAVFAKRDAPLASRFAATGVAVPSMSGIDLAVEGYMRRNNIPAGGVAVAKDGRLVYARGFTWGPSTAPLTTARSMFRMASCSKPLTSLLIHRLIEEEQTKKFARLRLDSKVKDVLGLTPPPNMAQADPRFDGITIEQLLSHTSGLRNDFASLDAKIVQAFGGRLPLMNKEWIARYLLTLELEHAPNTHHYSNAGYALLSAVVQHISGLSWFNALRTRILRPLGISRPRIAGSLISEAAPGEVRCLNGNGALTRSTMSPERPLVRAGYGDANLSVGVGVGGMAFTPADYVRILVALRPGTSTRILARPVAARWEHAAGWGRGTTSDGTVFYDHTGGLPNAHSYVAVRADGLALTVAFARDGVAAWPGPQWHHLLDAVDTWPGHDLFASLDLRPDI